LHALTTDDYLGTLLPKNVLPGLKTVGFWNASGPQEWGLDPHCNEGVKIMYLETGRMPFVADRERFDLRAGDLAVIRPGQMHQLGTPNIEPGKLHWLILDVGERGAYQEWQWPEWVILAKNDLAELTGRLHQNENTIWESTPSIKRAFHDLGQCVTHWNNPHAVSRLVVNLNQLLIGVLDALTNHLSSESKDLLSHRRKVELFIGDLEQARLDLSDVWTLEKMAAHCGLSETTFSKYCRELVNANPVEFLNQCRLDRAARQLLENPELCITEIAFANGFNSSQYFATVFKERFHKSPSAYRKLRFPSPASNLVKG
jgi:AraC family L-rhamnose operon regulatory protein RhaS